MEQAVSLALKRSPEVHAAQHQQQAQQARVDQAQSAYLPRLTLGVSYLAWWPKNELPLDLSFLGDFMQRLAPQLPPLPPPPIADIDDIHHLQAGLEAGYRLFDLPRRFRYRASQLQAVAASTGVEHARVALAFQVRATFLAALFSRDVKAITADSLQLARAHEKQAQLQHEVGTGSQVALAQARVRVAQLNAQLLFTQSEFERYRQQLVSQLGLKTLPPLQGHLAHLSRCEADKSLSRSPLLRQLRLSREAAELARRATTHSFWPTLDLFAKGELEYPHAMKTEWGPRIQGGVRLNWSLFDGGLRGALEDESQAQVDHLAAMSQATQERLRRQLIDLGAKGRTATASLASAKEILAQNEIYLRVAKTALSAGTGTHLEVHQAELALDQTRVDVQKSMLELALVCAETLMVRGLAHHRSGEM
jgi:outer membrane protein TolC